MAITERNTSPTALTFLVVGAFSNSINTAIRVCVCVCVHTHARCVCVCVPRFCPRLLEFPLKAKSWWLKAQTEIEKLKAEG